MMDFGASEEVTKEFMEILDTCEFARYSPSSHEGEMDELFQKTIKTISQLENEVRK